MIFRFSPLRCSHQRGIAAVEFALVSAVFFGFGFGAIELARALYLWNTLTQVVSRAARGALTNPGDVAAMNLVRQQAMSVNDPGTLILGGDIDDRYLRIDYLAPDQTTTVAPPPCPVQNVMNCTNDPDGACIRFVRVSLCMPGSAPCTKVPYQTLTGLDMLAGFNLGVSPFTTIVPAQTLGMPAACTP